jgi:hypothetical protein
VTSLQGDSQLPYLLGNISLLPFEALPESPQQQWRIEGGVSVTEQEERSDIRPHFAPLDPFGRGRQEQEVQAASESSTYAITDVKKQLVSVTKSYELKSPAPKRGEAGFTLTGAGVWKFNRKLNVSESLHMDQKLVVSAGNQQVTVPITLDYQLLTDAELAEIRAAREQAEAERKRKAEEMAQAAAEKKRRAEAPLTAEEKQAAMRALGGADTEGVRTALAELAEKTPQDPDAEVAGAIEALLKHEDRLVRVAAHKALLNWSLEYKPRGALDSQYKGPGGRLDSTARVVTADTPLYVGQIVQLKDHWRWVPADILELHEDGKVKVHPRGWSTTAWDKTVSRESIQLAPDELFQPYKSPSAEAEATEIAPRTWSDVTGTHKTKATYLGVADGQVRLKREDGAEISVPLDSLSQEDQEYVQLRRQAAEQPPNPFQVTPNPFE